MNIQIDKSPTTIRRTGRLTLAAVLLAGAMAIPEAHANGGPFIIQYPSGDPAAKGVFARVSPSLRPARESRLRVVEEILLIDLEQAYVLNDGAPLAKVQAIYQIENPTDESVEIDFGFPILRGIYRSPLSMTPVPKVGVSVDGESVPVTIISNEAIFGAIRKRSLEQIDAGIASDAELSKRVAAVRRAKGHAQVTARARVVALLTESHGWSERDARLLAELVSLEIRRSKVKAPPNLFLYGHSSELYEVATAALGPLEAIGNKKATQLLALLASRFDNNTSDYEQIFTDWGGDVRERSLDLETREVRPREFSVPRYEGIDPTVYARVDYLDDNAILTRNEKRGLKEILKDLPVIFTFAPMNLLHYRVVFPPGSRREVSVSYAQYTYKDTRTPESFQLAYVVHPASLWDEFGPIHLTVTAPVGVRLDASAPLTRISGKAHQGKQANRETPLKPQAAQRSAPPTARPEPPVPRQSYQAVIEDKTGELFIAAAADSWREAASKGRQ